MKVETSIEIKAPIERVWEMVSDIENCKSRLNCIEEVVILEKPEKGLVGLKWRETRKMFGRSATETMWITEAKENNYYLTRAESHGSIYLGTIKTEIIDNGVRLSMGFEATPQTFGAKIMGNLMGWMMKGATKKAIHKDLEDIKRAAEASE